MTLQANRLLLSLALIFMIFIFVAGCGASITNSPTGIAKKALDAAIQGDLQGVKQCLAPDNQPKVQSWVDVYGVADSRVDLANCRGVKYQLVARETDFAGMKQVNAVFESPCGSGFGYRSDKATGVWMIVENANDTWYIRPFGPLFTFLH